MYDYIKGAVAELTPTYAVIEAGGVGYFISISLQTYSALEGCGQSLLYVHFVVREDAQLLYGFATRAEREQFRLLIGVSGVGGGTARMILSTYSTADLANIIMSENAVLLKNVKGLGLKTAQKIIVELRDKILATAPGAQSAAVPAASSAVRDEAVAALTMLGFARSASDKAVAEIVAADPEAGVESVIRQALKKM